MTIDTNKIIHLYNFDKNLSTVDDLFANSIVLNTNLENFRSTNQDVYASYVSFNLRFDYIFSNYFFSDDCGAAIAKNSNPFISPTITRNGAQVCYFDGADDNLFVAYNSELNFQGVDFTIEFWFNLANSSGWVDLFDFRGTATGYSNWVISIDPVNLRPAIWDGAGGGIFTYAPNNSIQRNTWHHLALCSISNMKYLYIDGVLVLSYFYVLPSTNSSGITIGTNSSTTNDFQGYLSDIRFTRGVSRYTGNFTPPSNIPEITPKGPRICDQLLGDVYSSLSGGPSLEYGAGPFGEDALYFNGTSFLTIPYSNYFDICDGFTPFTLELWFKIDKNAILTSSSNRESAFLSIGWPDSGSFVNGISFRLSGSSTQTGNGIHCEFHTSIVDSFAYCQSQISKTDWHHIVFCKENKNGKISFYIDGKKQILADTIQDILIPAFTTSLFLKIGSDNYTNYVRGFKGWVANIRLTRECRYYGDFTAPTSANSSGDPYLLDTSLLMHFDSSNLSYNGLTNDVKGHIATIGGDTTLSNGGRFGGMCAYFDGLGDRIDVNYATDYDISFGDFTIELWFKPSQISSAASIFNQHSSLSAYGIHLWQPISNTNKIQLLVGDSSTAAWEVILTSLTSLVVDKWHHIAITREKIKITLWINGVAEATTSYGGQIYINSSTFRLGVGRSGTYPLNGYIDEFRLTKGVSRYLSTNCFTNTDGIDNFYTKLLLNCEGANNSTTILDSSLFGNTISTGRRRKN